MELATLLLSASLLVGEAPDTAPDAMEHRLAACAACHGRQGRSEGEQYYPSIAGKPSGYLYEQLLNFRDGRRHHEVMQRMFAFMSDDYLHAIADYYAQQAPALAQPATSASAERLAAGRRLVDQGDASRDIPACRACHGKWLTGAQPYIPGLVGLPIDYLNAQLGAWREGVRKGREPDCMSVVARRLSVEDLQAVTAWIASRPTNEAHAPLPRNPTNMPLQCGAVR